MPTILGRLLCLLRIHDFRILEVTYGFAPEELLNEIIWRSVKGADSEMPRPHTSRAWKAFDREDAERSPDLPPF